VEAQKCFGSNIPLTLVMVDIDFFKKVNDTFGHTEGDQVLCKVASLLKTSVRKKDTVARYGGEEFILILPETRLEESFVIAERIRRLVESTSLMWGRPGQFDSEHGDLQFSESSSEVERGVDGDGRPGAL